MSAVRDAMASVADAFLGERTPPRTRDQRSLLLVGHLPVMGGLWLTQFADRDARGVGATALVRVLHGEVEIEVLRAGGRKIEVAEGESFEQVINTLSRTVGRWIFCVFGEAESQIPAALDGIDRVILLTGADDAATVGAYKLLKGFVEHAERGGGTVPQVELSVVGATDAQARELAERLDRTTRAFLRTNLTVGVSMQRMDAVESSFRESYEFPSATLEGVCALVAKAVAARASRFDAPARSKRVAPRASVASIAPDQGEAALLEAPLEPNSAETTQFSAVLPFRIGPTAVAAAKVEAAGLSHESEFVAPKRAAVTRSEVVGIPPKLVTPRVASLHAKSIPDSYARLLVGLSPLAIRPPRWREIELAMDAQGGLHLVLRASRLGVAMHALAWAREHAELLTVAYPNLRAEKIMTDVVLESNEHGALVVPDALTDIAYHQVIALEVDGVPAWFCQRVVGA